VTANGIRGVCRTPDSPLRSVYRTLSLRQPISLDTSAGPAMAMRKVSVRYMLAPLRPGSA